MNYDEALEYLRETIGEEKAEQLVKINDNYNHRNTQQQSNRLATTLVTYADRLDLEIIMARAIANRIRERG